MKGFADAVALILKHEGGYVDDPRDPGGETNFGISKKAFPNEDIKGMTRERASEIYRENYWDKVRGDELPFPIALVTFDAAVNCGVDRAIRWLQHAVGVQVDGKIGPETLSAARFASDPLRTAGGCCRRRIIYYTQLNTWPTFGSGWTQRTLDTYRVCVEAV